MGIENIRMWHWMVIGVLAGLAVGYMHASLDPMDRQAQRRSMSQQRFERLLVQTDAEGRPLIRNIVIYPSAGDRLFVTGRELIEEEGEAGYVDFSLVARTPYAPVPQMRGFRGPRGGREAREASRESDADVMAYLDRMAQNHPHISYTYAWWAEPRATMALWTAGGLVVIGGVWPVVLGLLSGAGLGRRRQEEPAYDLDRFGGPEPAAEQTAREMTQQEEDQLRAAEAALEESLRAGGAGGAGAGAAAGQPAEPERPLRKLEGERLDGPSKAPAEQTPKEYRGQFYPTAVRGRGKQGE